MIGIIYILLGMMLGKELAEVLIVPSDVNSLESNLTGFKKFKGNQIWILLAASFGMGMLVFGWSTYMSAWAMNEIGVGNPLIWGNVLTMAAAIIILAVLYYRRYHAGSSVFTKADKYLVSDKRIFYKELFLFGGLLIFLTAIMFYVFYIKDGILYSGFTVYGDYAPHTAMMRSFSRENNYPTQYPHFGGEDVKYHFMFQFLTGNLEFLGLRLDLAYNLVSVMALLGFLMLLYSIACRLTGSMLAGGVTIGFFFFRSSFSFFTFVLEHVKIGDLWETFRDNTSFIGYTTNENWGLWNFNVYLNQRHLAFGMLITAVVLWVFLDWLDAGCAHEETGIRWFKNRLFTKEAWRCRSSETALMAGMFLGFTSFWNGAAVIGGLLILMGFAVFSDGKLDYLILAVTAVVFSVLQSKLFIWGNAVSPTFYWGFLSEDKSAAGVIAYLLQMSGIFFFGMIILIVLMRQRVQRTAMISVLFPAIFAFLVSLTPDIAVNHKYIMISFAFGFIFWAWAVVNLWKGRWFKRILAAVLVICLSITGIYDFVIIIRNNGPGHRVTVHMQSELTDWLSENLTEDDLILTPEYSMNEVTMSGVMMYMGWPYYAWSAGYDTYGRADKAKKIYSSLDKDEVKALVNEESITYILFEEGMEYEQESCREDVIASVFPLVYETEDRRIRIYET